jgi:Family of unknown function (DUF6152)
VRTGIDRVWRAATNSATSLFNRASEVDDKHCGGAIVKARPLVIGSLLVCMLTISATAFAHHAWHGYDMENLTSMKGTVTLFDWRNPHVWINFEMTDDKGNVEKWNAGGPSPSRMANTGWDKDTLKPGDQITAIGHRISDGTFNMRLVKVVLADGRELICYGGR